MTEVVSGLGPCGLVSRLGQHGLGNILYPGKTVNDGVLGWIQGGLTLIAKGQTNTAITDDYTGGAVPQHLGQAGIKFRL